MNKILTINALLLMALNTTPTYAEDSLWGNIDAPAKPPKAATKANATNSSATTSSATNANTNVPKLPDSIDAPLLPVPDAKPLPQKTTCDILKAKLVLSPEVMNTAEMQDQIRRTMQIVPDTYRFLVASPQAMNELYKAYSSQYIQQYCSR